MRIRTRPTQTLIALLAAVGLLVVSAPGLAATAPNHRPPHPSAGLRLAKQATSFDRTAKAAAALGVSEIRWELRNANTAGQPDVVAAYGALVAGDWDGNRTWTPGAAY